MDAKQQVVSSKQGKEVLELSSGKLLLIDQFMLGNRELIDRVCDSLPEECQGIVQKYGGFIVEQRGGKYLVFRDAKNRAIAAFSEDLAKLKPEALLREEIVPGQESCGKVLLDTRCLVLCDFELLLRGELMDEFIALGVSNKSKQGRDLLRDNGAAVRYGFSKYCEDLAIYCKDGLVLAVV